MPPKKGAYSRQAFENLYMNMKDQLSHAKAEHSDFLKYAETCAQIALESLRLLKTLFLSIDFSSIIEEIYFFKRTKPLFSSELIFYIKLLNIHLKWPAGSNDAQVNYIHSELSSLKSFFDKNEEFYCYYRIDCTHLDDKYFIRGKEDFRLNISGFFFDTDPSFCTSHDYKVAKIIANNRLQIYLHEKLSELNSGETNHNLLTGQISRLTWSESKTALVELIYGLHTQNVFNAGKADVKEIASFLEMVFNIDLGDYYRTYLELRMRKTGKTKFLETMAANLIKRMEYLDEK